METMNANSSLPFAPYYQAFGAPDSTFTSDFQPVSPVSPISPDSLFSPLDDFGTDFTSESAGSPTSPASPGFPGGPYDFSGTDDWSSWDNVENLPDSENLFQRDSNLFEGSLLASVPAQKMAMSPAVNPMDLAVPSTTGFLFDQPTLRSAQPVESVPLVRESREDAAPSTKRYPRRNLKRKTSSSTSDEDVLSRKRVSPSPPPPRSAYNDEAEEAESQAPKKTAHNMIEKRYRNNLNDKIARLRDAVPALRAVAQRYENPSGEDTGADFVDGGLGDLGPIQKLNKATILSRATEYIGQLEKYNKTLEAENGALKGRAEGLQMLLMGRGGVAGGVWN